MREDPRISRLAVVLALALAGQAIACGDDGATCPDDLPADCPEPTPSYQDEIAPIIADACVPCHGPGGPESTRDLSTYQAVFDQRVDVLGQIYGCRMPPHGAAPLEPDERQALLGWLVCGAPDN
jgi:hypothetical protein